MIDKNIKQRCLGFSQAIALMSKKFIEQRCLGKQRSLEILNNAPYGTKKFLNNDPYKNFKQRCLRKIAGLVTENTEIICRLAFFITFFYSLPVPRYADNMPAFKPGLTPVRCMHRDDMYQGKNLNVLGKRINENGR